MKLDKTKTHHGTHAGEHAERPAPLAAAIERDEEDVNPVEVIAQLRAQYQSLEDSRDDILAECDQVAQTDPTQAANMRRQYADSHDEALNSYLEARSRLLREPADVIKQLGDAATNAQNSIDAALLDLQNIKNSLNEITKAVKFVGSLVAALP